MELGQAWHVDQRCLGGVPDRDLVLFLLPARQPSRRRAHELECGDLLFGHPLCHWILFLERQASLRGAGVFG